VHKHQPEANPIQNSHHIFTQLVYMC